MRKLIAFIFAASLSASALAETATNDFALRLDKLFAALHSELNDTTSKLVEMQIWALWASESTPESVAQLAEASAALSMGDQASAEKKLDALIKAQPDFAEAWNRRATMYFMQQRYEESLADIAHVLELEPRHFGALSGKGMVLRALNRPAEALRAMKESLAVDPYLAGMKNSIEQMEKLNPDL